MLCGLDSCPVFAQQWNLVGQPFSDTGVSGLFFINTDTGYAVSSSGKIAITTDGGVSWNIQQSLTEVTLYDIFFLNDQDGYVCGNNGKLLSTHDGGNTWDDISLNFNGDLYCIYFLDENKGFIGASSGIIYRTINGGVTWDTISTNTSDIHRISFIGDQVSFAVTASGNYTSGYVIKTTDGWNTWSVVYFNEPVGLLGLAFPNKDVIVAAGSYRTIISSVDGGVNWNTVIQDPIGTSGSPLFLCGYAASDHEAYMANNLSGIYSTPDNALTWDSVFVGCCNITSLFFPKPYIGFFGNGEGQIYKLCKKPAPAAFINGPSVACTGSMQIYSSNTIDGAASYVWTVPPGAVFQTINDTTIQVTFGTASGKISFHAINECGTGATSVLLIDVNVCLTPLTEIINPHPGDANYFTYADTIGIYQGDAGCNYNNYSFTELQDSASYSDNFLPLDSTYQFAAQFPEATVAIKKDDVYAFYQCNSSHWAIVGYASEDYVLHYPQPLPIFTYPMNCDESILNTSNVIYTNGGIETRRAAKIATHYDGYGILFTPPFSFGVNVIRMHEVETYVDSAFLGSTFLAAYTSVYDNYFFFRDSNDGNLLLLFHDFNFDDGTSTFSSRYISYSNFPVGITEAIPDKNNWLVAADYNSRALFVSSLSVNTPGTLFQFVDLTGRVIMQNDAESFSIGNGKYLVPFPESSAGLLVFKITEQHHSSTFKILQWR
ncbi:MAG: YCF48-related protein [Chitinophagales bacterium]